MGKGMVIIGAGEAGGCAAVAMREAGWDGPITIIGEERHPPYERPPLSKAAITDETPPEPKVSAEAQKFKEFDILHRSDIRVGRIDRNGKRVHIEDGGSIGYERLLLATGALARSLPVKGGEYALTLRSHEDVWALRQFFGQGRHIIIVGGGLIGLELAASANRLGARVTVIESQDRLLARAVPADIAARIHETHRRHGVRFHLAAAVEEITRTGVRLRNGDRIDGDVVVAAVGAQPDVALATAADLPVDNGIVTDARLRTGDPDIFACGDCAATRHPLFGDTPRRFESWQVARDQGELAGRNMVLASQDQSAAPWFWSDQYDQQLQIAGLPELGETVVERLLDEETTLHFYLSENGTLVGAAAFGPLRLLARDMRISQRLIARRARPDATVLAAPDQRLKTLLAA